MTGYKYRFISDCKGSVWDRDASRFGELAYEEPEFQLVGPKRI
jgi:hypothetical protein